MTPAQLIALATWATHYGRTWKQSLRRAWDVSGHGYEHYAPELQQPRNTYGPSWLSRYKPPRTAQASASRSEQHARYIDCGPGAWDDTGYSPDF